MELVFHSHHANAPDRLRAGQGPRRLGRRMRRAGAIRCDEDGAVRTVEREPHAPDRRALGA